LVGRLVGNSGSLADDGMCYGLFGELEFQILEAAVLPLLLLLPIFIEQRIT